MGLFLVSSPNMPLASGLSPDSKKPRVAENENGMEVETPDDPEFDETGGLAPQINTPKWASTFKQELLSGMRGIMKEEVQPIKQEVAELRSKVEEVDVNAKAALKVANEAKAMVSESKGVPGDEELRRRIAEVESKFNQTSLEEPSVLFGNLGDLTWTAACEKVTKILDSKLEEPSEIYHKGELKGLVFAKFSSTTASDKVITTISKVKPKSGDKEIYCKKDRPLEVRVAFSFLLGLRHQLVQWGYSKAAVRVDETRMTMTFQGKSVLHAEVREGSLHLVWLEPAWSAWSELQGCDEMKQLKEKAKETLKNAYDKGGKGDGKGGEGKGAPGSTK